MTAVHKRAARRELEAARILRVRRHQYRLRYESKSDIDLVPMPVGPPLSVEVKTRAKLPRLITQALAQAKAYEPAAIPAAVISEKGAPALLVLPLAAFARIAGIKPIAGGG